MSFDTTHDDAFVYSGPLAARMACHMGDFKGSVLCNILGDQPLFYIDYVDADEADFTDPMTLLAGEETGGEFYPENLDFLRRRIARLESASQHIDGYQREDIEKAFAAATSAKSSETYSADDVCALLRDSSFAAALLDGAQKNNVRIELNAQIDAAAYDREARIVCINPRLPLPMAAMMAVRALRQAWLHVNGAAIHPLHFAPEEAVLLNRIQQADLVCAVIRAAWEMNLSGKRDAWARILTGSAYDIAVGFAREAIVDFRALNNGMAAHAAFERWFFSGRCKEADRKLIQHMLADHHGLVFDNPAVSKMVTGDIIARTGDQPLGKNYLTGMIDVILSDPLFTEVRDRSNANFLWFIKFERSFRATEEGMNPGLEQNLQGIPQVPSQGIPAGASTGAPSQEQADANQTAEIVTLKVAPKRGQKNGKAMRAAKNGPAIGAGNMATVYYLDHFQSV